ncbi:MAG: CoA transferase [Proteobacteria bacterium]|jgi:CoA:oxalate CoA-transferase|nr:CoA transferase [Ramlibacter sp.]MCA0214110.1 CoA transferase [Pseudomonadota bacterium]
MAQVLQGFKVLDFTHVLAGPIATNYLCQQGADVIKVESGKGDTMRNYGGQTFADGMGPSFISVNAGKRSIVLDLKDEGHLEVARKLVKWADVVVENFRPGVMDRMGLGYAACRSINPSVVFCSVSGFGQSGPLKGNPAIDQIIQSMSGLMTLSGEPGSPPVRIGFPVVDTFTGLLGAFAMMSALLQRERTGQGQYIDVAMMDAAMVMMVSVAGPWLAGGVRPQKQGNLGYSKSPTADTFPTGDGDLTLGAVRQDQYEALCRVVQREDLITDARFADRYLRQQNAAALRAEIIRALATRSAVQWEQLLNDGGVAAGAVRDLPAALALPHLQTRRLTQPARIEGSQAQVLNTGFWLEHDPTGTDRPPPRLGEHTREVMAQLGYTPQEIDALCGLPAKAQPITH